MTAFQAYANYLYLTLYRSKDSTIIALLQINDESTICQFYLFHENKSNKTHTCKKEDIKYNGQKKKRKENDKQ